MLLSQDGLVRVHWNTYFDVFHEGWPLTYNLWVCGQVTSFTSGKRFACYRYGLYSNIASFPLPNQFPYNYAKLTAEVYMTLTRIQLRLGSPEMAFVHALAAAGAASFIARACRDGQLASCGCSRSVRPNHLHDDWTWGGCGDDLEYGYK